MARNTRHGATSSHSTTLTEDLTKLLSADKVEDLRQTARDFRALAQAYRKRYGDMKDTNPEKAKDEVTLLMSLALSYAMAAERIERCLEEK